ncbi:MAG: flagellar basal-body rod protein FlgB [Epulopiscium sp. Nele67-Bin005]|nr:MAG: flagellar basal-body rod protein FlgB [Epulopiscium sp. Nele67-Bin005]
MFYNLDVTAKALDANMLKYEKLTNNIANIDTVGYKRQDVAFENLLQGEIDRNGGSTKNLNINAIEPTVFTDMPFASMRYDENNIDIDKENAELSKAKLRYDVLITRANAQITRYQTIFQTIN